MAEVFSVTNKKCAQEWSSEFNSMNLAKFVNIVLLFKSQYCSVIHVKKKKMNIEIAKAHEIRNELLYPKLTWICVQMDALNQDLRPHYWLFILEWCLVFTSSLECFVRLCSTCWNCIQLHIFAISFSHVENI